MDVVTKFLMSIGALVLAFFAGYKFRTPETVVRWKTKTEVKEVEKVVTTRTTERTSAPDGTTKEIITEKITQNTEVAAQRSLSRPTWSLGLSLAPNLEPPRGIEIGYRLFGDVWTAAEYDWRDHEVLIKLKVEF